MMASSVAHSALLCNCLISPLYWLGAAFHDDLILFYVSLPFKFLEILMLPVLSG